MGLFEMFGKKKEAEKTDTAAKVDESKEAVENEPMEGEEEMDTVAQVDESKAIDKEPLDE